MWMAINLYFCREASPNAGRLFFVVFKVFKCSRLEHEHLKIYINSLYINYLSVLFGVQPLNTR